MEKRKSRLSEIRMVKKAFEQRWEIRPEIRAAVLNQMATLLVSPATNAREKTAAARAIIAAEQQNQSDDHKVLDVQLNDARVASIAAELGIDPGLIIDATSEASGGVENPPDTGGRAGKRH